MLSEEESRALTGKIISMVRADDALVRVTSQKYSNLRFAANSFLTSGVTDTAGALIRVWVGKKRGEAFTNDLSDAALKQAVDQAESFARLSPVDVEYLPHWPGRITSPHWNSPKRPRIFRCKAAHAR